MAGEFDLLPAGLPLLPFPSSPPLFFPAMSAALPLGGIGMQVTLLLPRLPVMWEALPGDVGGLIPGTPAQL